jgi:hypothetical protein
LGLLLTFASSSGAYQFVDILSPSDESLYLKWGPDSMPVVYHFNVTSPRHFSLEEAIEATQASFDTWESIETSSISFQYGGTTTAEPFVFFDSINTLGFVNDPQLEGTGILAATSWIFYSFTGEIAESDIYFNNAYPWSVSDGGTDGRFDFQSVATHEIGHFLGLGHSHSGIMETEGFRRRLVEGSAIMFPFAYPAGSIQGRTPVADDITGISVLYPAREFDVATGTLTGSVFKDGEGLYGAHVNAFNPFTGELIGIFTDSNGVFEHTGLKPGPYILRVNPITDPTSPEDFSFPESQVDMDFRDAFYEGQAEVLPGETTSGIRIEVQR